MVIPRSTLNNVRQFDKGQVKIDKSQVLGRGVFGKCFLGAIGPASK